MKMSVSFAFLIAGIMMIVLALAAPTFDPSFQRYIPVASPEMLLLSGIISFAAGLAGVRQYDSKESW